MDIETTISRIKNALIAVALFMSAVFIVYRGNTVADPGTSAFIVPIMCSLTALAMGATGLTLVLRAMPKPE